MSCEKLWQSPAFYSTQVLPSDSPSYAAALQGKQRSIGTSPLLRPGFFLKLALLALLATFFPGARLHAQTGLITGTVVDPSGAAIPGAQVQIINQATGAIDA